MEQYSNTIVGETGAQGDDADILQRAQVHHVPGWVKGIIVGGMVLFLFQLPSFPQALSGAVQKRRASVAYDGGRYDDAIGLYQALEVQYPGNAKFIVWLGLSYYRAGRHEEALRTFDRLVGTKVSKADAKQVNNAIDDIVSQLPEVSK